jgi:hypothetical protein
MTTPELISTLHEQRRKFLDAANALQATIEVLEAMSPSPTIRTTAPEGALFATPHGDPA